jgi:hypothetical protein
MTQEEAKLLLQVLKPQFVQASALIIACTKLKKIAEGRTDDGSDVPSGTEQSSGSSR